jgi:hypothetical protein
VRHCRCDLNGEANPAFNRAAVIVGSLVHVVGQKLVNEIPVGSVDLDAVHAGLGTVAAVVLDGAGAIAVTALWGGCSPSCEMQIRSQVSGEIAEPAKQADLRT